MIQRKGIIVYFENVEVLDKLDKNIVVTGGEGTKDNPYTIEKK